MKNISVIGCTGSVGEKTLNVAKRLGHNIEAMVAYQDIDKLAKLDKIFCPNYVGVINETLYKQAKDLFKERLVCGHEALTFSCGLKSVDTVVISVTGINGLYPVYEAIKNNKRIALANKESVVAGGELLINTLKQAITKNKQIHKEGSGIVDLTDIIPLDSEHSAVFQCLKAGKTTEIKKIILTASGGAFYNLDRYELSKILPQDVFHPNWKMGRKITIDSSTMMNKALEIVEAAWLFGCKNIDYVVHKESIIHSMVQFTDGAIMAQLGKPDMELPIQYALTYPDRVFSDLNTFELATDLSMQHKNNLFYAPELAYYVLNKEGSAGAVMNAANEAAVNLFEEGKIGFLDIVKIVKNCLYMSEAKHAASINDIIEVHSQTISKVVSDYKDLIKESDL